MLQSPISVDPADTPAGWLAAHGGDLPVLFFSAAALTARHARFRRGFPGAVSFAVKANPCDVVIGQLCAEGMTAFDVASPGEIAQIAKACPGATLNYHNPVRSRAEIRAGIAAGVASWSVDAGAELDKLLAEAVPGDAEIAVRIALPVPGAAYDFGAKFGATPDAAVALLTRVAAAGLRPALTFHVGTQCADPGAWTAYMAAAADIARRARVTLVRLNTGGGFPAGRDGGDPPLEPIFAAIRAGLAGFDAPPPLICEPGRALVADAFAHAVRVKSRRGAVAYLNDGTYGGLSEFPSIGLPRFAVLTAAGAPRRGAEIPFTLFGPTCDSLDRLPGAPLLPDTLQEGDWLLFGSTGAYLNGVSTAFNGYGGRDRAGVASLWTDPAQPLR